MRRNSITSTVVVRDSDSENESEDKKRLTSAYTSLSLAWMKKRMSKENLLNWMLAFIFLSTAFFVFRLASVQSSHDQQSSSDISQRARQLSLKYDTPADMPVFRRDKKVNFQVDVEIHRSTFLLINFCNYEIILHVGGRGLIGALTCHLGTALQDLILMESIIQKELEKLNKRSKFDKNPGETEQHMKAFVSGIWSAFRVLSENMAEENVAYNKRAIADPDHW
jgi:hypothetical protein